MKIYTKGGDAGETGLFGGERVPKDHLRIQVYGTLDEANAILGWAVAQAVQPTLNQLKERLQRIQSELFQLGAELATPAGKKLTLQPLGQGEIAQLESEIDQMESSLPPLRTFILPGGTPLASALHLARTVIRRAERELIGFHRVEVQRPEVLQYLNRLSDALFVTARYANHLAGSTEHPWIAPKTEKSI